MLGQFVVKLNKTAKSSGVEWMTQAKDMIALAQKLAGPAGVDTFDAEIRERRAQVFKNALDPEASRKLMSLSALENMLDRPDAPVETTDIFVGGHILRLGDIQHRSNRRVIDVASEHLSRGATLRVRDIERSSAPLAVFARAVSQVYAAQAQINLYLTPPGTAGFPPHFDNTDVFILQVAGSKKWSLHHEYSNRVRLPHRDVAWDPEHFRPMGEAETHILSVGDVLYLPRGAMHSAECTKQESLHLTISLTSLTVADALLREVHRLAQEEPGLRERVAWSMAGDASEHDHLRMTLATWLVRLADQIDPEQTIAEMRETFISTQEGSSSSAISDMIAELRSVSK